jgi:hypothetical protein
MNPVEVLEFLESFRLLHGRVPSRSRLEGVRYQTRIKRLMNDWTEGP